jgi:hypothetical protein
MAHLVTVRKASEDDPAMANVPPQFRRFISHLSAERSWNYSEGDETEIILYTNCPEAELILNGKSLGVYSLADYSDDGYITAAVPFAPGTLEVIARSAGDNEVRDALTTAGAPSALAASLWGGPLHADGEDIAQIEVSVLDDAGNPVSDSSDMIEVHLQGPIELLGIENGDLSDNTDYAAPCRRASQGHAVVYVRSSGEPGTGRVRLSSGGGIRHADVIIDLK